MLITPHRENESHLNTVADFTLDSDFKTIYIKSGRSYKNVGKVSDFMVKGRCDGGLPHRIVALQFESLVDGDRLLVPEPIHIVIWMVAAMRHQEAALKRYTIQKAGYLVHMIFPVCSQFSTLCENVSLTANL